MATQGTPAGRANQANPFQHIPFHRGDRSAPERNGGGGAKELVPINAQYRQALLQTLNAAALALRPEIERHRSSPGVLVFKLRETAIAKSHRPNTLAAEAGLQPAGIGRIEEMLVAANAASIDTLARVIQSRNTQMIRANLSAVERIEAWDSRRRLQTSFQDLRQRGRAILRAFKFHAPDATARNLDTLAALLRTLGIPAFEIRQRWGPPVYRIVAENLTDEILNSLAMYPGLRAIFPEPIITPAATGAGIGPVMLMAPNADLPIIGVFDTGAAATATSLQPWIAGTEVFVLPPDTDYVHGTAVASLVAGAKVLNNGHPWLPPTSCRVHNVCGLESTTARVTDLIERLRTAIPNAPHVKVWNLSLQAGEINDDEFSMFAHELDALGDQHGVLFVVAAGNYLGQPRRGWPDANILSDRLTSPADSVRALSVGAIAHLNGAGALVAAGHPAPYSRRGPGPVFTPKPDVVHAGGGVHAAWNLGTTSIQVLQPTNTVSGNFGTSFAAPIIAAMSGHVWQCLDGREDFNVSPSMVKALMIHSARLASPDYSASDRRYFGSGMPVDALSALYDSDDCFTLMFEAMVIPGYKWRKTPYPIPACLLHNGRLRAEVIITAVYAPPLDPNAGAEYVRANAKVSFGVLNGTRIAGKVPMEGEDGSSGYESAQIENGGKWSPVKLHRKSFPNGVAGDQWAIQVEALLRANEPELAEPLNVCLVVSLRALDQNAAVHTDGMQALAASNWIRQTLPVRVPITV